MMYILMYQQFLKASIVFWLLLLAVGCDTFFGCFRAWRQHRWNSSVGIDGAIRKVGMVASVCFAAIVDLMLDIDLLFFVPEQVAAWLGLERAGIMAVLGLLFIAYELVSVLKNMVLCGLPVKGVLAPVYKLLQKYTTELPNMDELSKKDGGQEVTEHGN